MECDAYRDDLMDVLYGEADAATARRFNEHQASCAACREEIASFRRVRHELDGWAVAPRPRLAIAAFRPARWLAAAAGLVAVLGGALVLAKGEVRYPNGQVALRLAAAPTDEAGELRRLLAEQETRHQQAIAELKAAASRPVVADASFDREALLAEVGRLIKDSETRQATAFMAGLTSLEERTQTQRRVDMAQVGAGFSYLEGKTGMQAARTTELMRNVLVASQGGGR